MTQEEIEAAEVAAVDVLFWKFDALRKGFLCNPIAERDAFRQVVLGRTINPTSESLNESHHRQDV